MVCLCVSNCRQQHYLSFCGDFLQKNKSFINFFLTKCYAFVVAGGFSIGCPMNAGAAGTFFNADLLSLRVGNDNVTTETETPLLDFPTTPLWSNVFVENNAKVLVPLLWTRVQVT